MTTARRILQTEVIDGKIYVIGGNDGSRAINTVEEYDPTINKWTLLASMTTARYYFQTEVIDGKIYAIGGRSGSSSEIINIVEEYDPTANKWITLAPMAKARYLFPTEVISGEIYAIGGTGEGGYLSNVEVYTLALDELSTPANLSTIAGNAQITLSWDAVNGATSYNIKRSETAGGPYTTISSVSGSATSCIDIGVLKGKTYYYVVSATISGKESPNSNEASATIENSSTIKGNRAILLISFNNGKEKEYDLSVAEIDAFVDWYDKKSNGSGKSYFAIPKYSNVKPFIGRNT